MEHQVVVASADVACASIGQGVFSGSPLCTLVVPNALLLHLHANKSGYVEGVNECIKGRMLTLSKTCARLETALQKIAGKLASKLKKCQGSRERSKVRSSHSNFLVGEGETISVQDVVEPLQERVKRAEQGQQELRSRLQREESAREAETVEKETLQAALHVACNRGKNLHEVGERQKRRKLADVKKYTQQTLQPCMESYGLQPTRVTAVTNQGSSVTFELASDSSAHQTTSEPLEDKTATVLFLLDQYGVSDSFYHELAQTVQELPRLHHVKRLRKELNSTVEPVRLDPPYSGCYLHVREAVTSYLSSTLNQTIGPHNNRVRLKISGDGTRFSASSSFIFLTFSFPMIAKDIFAAAGNHTFASARGSETYEFLRNCFAPVWLELAQLIANPVVHVQGVDYNLDIVCGSDYKFLLLMMGLNNATSTYSCLWCSVGKDDRWNMSIAEEVYTSPPPCGKARTSAALNSCVGLSQPKRHLGSKNPPILSLEPSSLVLDELHLLLRIGDVLLRNVILQADSLDHQVYMREGRRSENHLRTLELLVRRCGVSFTISPVVNENNKPVAGLFNWTALTRRDKLKVLKALPGHLAEVIPPQDASRIGSLWKEFVELYQTLTSECPSAEEVHSRGKIWVNTFLSLNHLEGYQRKNVTPYMHCLVYHVPEMIRKYGNVITFSGQGVEKNNDAAKHFYYSSNKHDPCGEVLQIESRQDALQSCRRKKRHYNKSNSTYWECEIKEKRARQL